MICSIRILNRLTLVSESSMYRLKLGIIIEELTKLFGSLTLLSQTHQSAQEGSIGVWSSTYLCHIDDRVNQGHSAACIAHNLLDEMWLTKIGKSFLLFFRSLCSFLLLEHVSVLGFDLITKDSGHYRLRNEGSPHLWLESIDIMPLEHDTWES